MRSLYALYLNGNPQLLCSQIESLRAKLSSTYITLPANCSISPGKVDLTNQFGVVNSDHFHFLNQEDSALGSFTLENGILTFTPAKGVTGLISIQLNIVIDGVWYYYQFRTYIPTPKRKTKRFPIWLMLPEVLEPQPAK
jgi:hypothetical protein